MLNTNIGSSRHTENKCTRRTDNLSSPPSRYSTQKVHTPGEIQEAGSQHTYSKSNSCGWAPLNQIIRMMSQKIESLHCNYQQTLIKPVRTAVSYPLFPLK